MCSLVSERPCEGIKEISHFLMVFLTLPVLNELWVASLPDWRSLTHCTCISPGIPRKIDSLRVLQVSYQEGEGRG